MHLAFLTQIKKWAFPFIFSYKKEELQTKGIIFVL